MVALHEAPPAWHTSVAADSARKAAAAWEVWDVGGVAPSVAGGVSLVGVADVVAAAAHASGNSVVADALCKGNAGGAVAAAGDTDVEAGHVPCVRGLTIVVRFETAGPVHSAAALNGGVMPAEIVLVDFVLVVHIDAGAGAAHLQAVEALQVEVMSQQEARPESRLECSCHTSHNGCGAGFLPFQLRRCCARGSSQPHWQDTRQWHAGPGGQDLPLGRQKSAGKDADVYCFEAERNSTKHLPGKLPSWCCSRSGKKHPSSAVRHLRSN